MTGAVLPPGRRPGPSAGLRLCPFGGGRQRRDLTAGELAPFGAVRELQHNTAPLEVERPRLEECLQRMFGALPVVDLDVKDIPIEEGIAYFYEKAGVSAP